MTFRDRLIATIRAARPVLESPGVLVVDSEVPNLMEADAAATLVVSQDLDVGVPVGAHAALRARLDELRDFEPSADEPSVWTPRIPGLLELNFVGIDPAQDPAEAYVLEDERLPLLVFGALSLVSRGAEVEIGGTRCARTSRSSHSSPRGRECRIPSRAGPRWPRCSAASRRPIRRARDRAAGAAPPRLILVVPAGQAAQLSSARPLGVRLSAELLAAECLVLVPFPA